MAVSTLVDMRSARSSFVSGLMVVALLGTALVSCSDADADGQAAGSRALPPLGAPLNCDDPIDVVDSVPDEYSAFSDVVALPTGEDQLQRGRSGPDNDLESRRMFSKMGLLVRPGTTFQIHVGPASQGNALIHWGNAGTDDPVGSIAVETCAGDSDTWIVFPGGVWTLDPACVDLLVITDSDQEQLQLPIAADCS